MAVTCSVLLRGQQLGAETRLCLTGLLSPDRMVQLPSCRSQDHFRLCDVGHEGELLCGKVTKHDYSRASCLIKPSSSEFMILEKQLLNFFPSARSKSPMTVCCGG